MTKFTDGPAAGVVLGLRRAPLFLRVTLNAEGTGGEFDALDQLGDTPRPGEVLYAYRKTKDGGWVHIRSGRKGGSGFFMVAEYEVVEPQPDDATMRTTEAWRAWCFEQVKKGKPSESKP